MCSSALANFFIEKAKTEKIRLTNLKLQKLMFIGYGWVLSLTGKDITNGEGFQAWQHGPVLPSVYHQMKRFGDGQIDEYATDYDSEEKKIYIPTIQDEEVLGILEKVWEIYKTFSEASLKNLTHDHNSPWDQVYSRDSWFTDIDKEKVKQYYLDYIDNLLQEAC